MRSMLIPSLGLALVLVAAPGTARAHIAMTSPEARYPDTEQKDAPCGRAGGARTDRVAVFEPGETIVVSWTETIDHDSHYRVAFDADGDDDLDEPVLTGGEWITPAGVRVLADHVEDRPGGGPYAIEVTLPRVECERCTLQLMQMMYGRADPYYYQCADLALRCATPGCLDEGADAGSSGADDAGAERDAGTTGSDAGAPRDAGTTGGDGGDRTALSGGCAAGGSGAPMSSGLVMTIALGGLAWRRRAR